MDLETAKKLQRVHERSVNNWTYGAIVDYKMGCNGEFLVRYAFGGWWAYRMYWVEEIHDTFVEWVKV